jgi:acetyl-CoA carboxylase biotin carboxyl carrier protein
VDLRDIKAIIDLMKKNSISEFELEKQDFKIRLKRGSNGGARVWRMKITMGAFARASCWGYRVRCHNQRPLGPVGPIEQDIKSPMIGTFYRSPSPESRPMSRWARRSTRTPWFASSRR